jgi:hypothetical protein
MKMNLELKKAIETEMAIARKSYRDDELTTSMKHLEVAHVLGQRYAIPHIVSHWWMLKIGLKEGSMAKIAGQAIRIVLGAIGSTVGTLPVGNTGGTNISMFKRLPIDPAIRHLVD